MSMFGNVQDVASSLAMSRMSIFGVHEKNGKLVNATGHVMGSNQASQKSDADTFASCWLRQPVRRQSVALLARQRVGNQSLSWECRIQNMWFEDEHFKRQCTLRQDRTNQHEPVLKCNKPEATCRLRSALVAHFCGFSKRKIQYRTLLHRLSTSDDAAVSQADKALLRDVTAAADRTLEALYSGLPVGERPPVYEDQLGKSVPLLPPSQWWKRVGHLGQSLAEVSTIRRLALSWPAPRKICEVGFHAGHSAALWLEGTYAKLHEFDLLSLPYSADMRRFIEARYKGRAQFYIGEPSHTMAAHAALVKAGREPGCDIWFLNGDRRNVTRVQADLDNALAGSRRGATVVMDDALSAQFPVVKAMWEKAVASGRIRQAGPCEFVTLAPPAGLKGWCSGRVQRGTQGDASARRGKAAGKARQRGVFGWSLAHACKRPPAFQNPPHNV